MTPRIPENIWSFVTVIGSNTMPPRDPNNDDEDEENEDEDHEDGDEEPPVVREPDE